MDKKVINEDQFRKLVIKEAKKIFAEDDKTTPIVEGKKPETSSRIKFDDVEKLINEIEGMNKSITSISLSVKDEEVIEESAEAVEETKGPNRDLDVNEHNRKKNTKHVNESEKDRIKRMLDYNVPKDGDR
jgi:hypothetical protein